MTATGSANGSKPQRLFFALWPEPVLQQRLYALVQSSPEHLRSGRPVRAENLHLTLAFLGSVSAEMRACLEQRAQEIRVPTFELPLERLGYFRRGGVLWAGTVRVPPPLLELVNALKAAQVACGLAPEDRAYEVHITLVRDLPRCPPQSAVTPIVWPVRQFALVRSQTTPAGARYEVLRFWQLAPSAGR